MILGREYRDISNAKLYENTILEVTLPHYKNQKFSKQIYQGRHLTPLEPPPAFTMNTKPVLPQLPLLALLVATVAIIASAAPSITRFQLVDARTGAVVRALTNGDTISVSHPFTITAIPAIPGARRVTFTSPFPYVSRGSPFALSDSATTPLGLIPNEYELTAYANSGKANALTVRVTVKPPGFPSRGPMPSSSSLGVPAPPPVKGSCVGKPAPSFEELSISAPHEYRNGWAYSGKINYCTAGRQAVRMRLMFVTYKPEGGGRPDEIITQEQDNFETLNYQLWKGFPYDRCGDSLIYLEACALNADGSPLCGTSEMFFVPKPQVKEPLPAFRPPIVLELAPGDKAKVVFRITDETKNREGLLNDEDITGPFNIASVIKARDGFILKSNLLKLGKSTVAKLPADGKGRGVTWRDNSAKVFLKFGRPGCKNDFDTFEERYATKLIVKKTVVSLIRQDKKLPKFDQPEYPATLEGEPVTITVRNALNVGGGKRSDGSTPALHYQWYLSTTMYTPYREYAEPIVGETGPTLTLAKAECQDVSGGRWGVFGLRYYYVDVCNTFGCRRSQKVTPNIRSPPLAPGETWSEVGCCVQDPSGVCI